MSVTPYAGQVQVPKHSFDESWKWRNAAFGGKLAEYCRRGNIMGVNLDKAQDYKKVPMSLLEH